jgi:uncharacterized protein
MPECIQCRFCGAAFEGEDAWQRAQEHEQACAQRPPVASASAPLPSSPVPEETSQSLAAHSGVRGIFFNQRELRAGWRLLIYLVLLVIIGLVLTAGAAWVLHARRGRFNPFTTQLMELLLFVAALVPALIMGKVERRSLAYYGLPMRQAFGRRFWEGLLFGLVAITLLIVMMRGVHAFYFGHIALHGGRVLKWAVFWAVFFLWVGFFEEFTFRGYTLFTLTTGMGFWPAALLLSALFGAIHLVNPGEAWVGGLSAGLIGLFLAFSFRRTGSLWWAVGFHQSFDWGETFLYSVPNSGMSTPGHLLDSYFHGPRWLTGGTIGPEGSALVFLLILLMFIALDRMYRTVQFPRSQIAAAEPPPLGDPSLLR